MTSSSISSQPKDFSAPITPVYKLCVQGIGGRLEFIDKGTVSWNILDNDGINHKIVIPRTLYVNHLRY